ncbi:MAG: heme ABC exporter ATP-binding protein CcmA [Rhodobacteraceae bacterium]|nr:heme ABC exporter ATP-binding protein CcmA [Paracoccaceae bacterium]
MQMTVTNLACARGGLQVLAGVSFTLASGQVLVVRGSNGAGKTTLLRTLAGLTPPLSGGIGVLPEAIAYAGHADGLKVQLTVAEHLRFWAGIFGTRGGQTAIDSFDLAGLLDRRAGTLSAGQRRRLGLARLLVTGRPLWCLDEPTTSLDAANTARLIRAVTAHLKGGGSAIIATHSNLDLPTGQILDITPFVAKSLPRDDPFGDGAFA